MEDKIIFQTTTKTGQELVIRYPKISDLESMTKFINEISSERTFMIFQGEQQTLEEERKFLESKIEKIKNNQDVFLIAFVDGKYAGSSGISLGSFIKKTWGDFGIVIGKNYRGQGIGKKLMELVISESLKNLKDLDLVTLEVFGDNSIAQNLYKKIGFVEYGRLPESINHKENFVDAILMYKKIK